MSANEVLKNRSARDGITVKDNNVMNPENRSNFTKKMPKESVTSSSSRTSNNKGGVVNIDNDDYDRCSDLDDYSQNNSNNENTENCQFTRHPSSPMKRNNQSLMEESPKKRLKMAQLRNTQMNRSNNLSLTERTSSPSRRLKPPASLCMSEPKKSFSSTPKSERRMLFKSRIKEMSQNSEAIERNLSKNWADIIEELEEQGKELNEYVEKVSLKYKIDQEKLLKNVESDAETLRKRQKKINFGKVTPEYQRYIQEVPRKERQAYHPKTPNKFRKCSRRKFDGLIKKWRKILHVWDENPDALPEFRYSMENDDPDNENDCTEDFGGTSNITNISYNVDDYEIVEDDLPTVN